MKPPPVKVMGLVILGRSFPGPGGKVMLPVMAIVSVSDKTFATRILSRSSPNVATKTAL
jgi:hypothetical protein